ncbi:MAG TPA: formyltransferase [Gemmatimonadaceae bacterium]
MSAARVVVFAYSDVGHACLALLLSRGVAVPAVYTHADAPGERLWFPSVAELARAHGIPVRLDADLSRPEELETLRALAPDVILSCYYRSLLPEAALGAARLGAYNVHGSLLPRYRGRAPVNWAVLHGERETGATLHVMTARADAGDIVDQEAVPIGPDDTAAEVQARVTAAAVAVLDRQLAALLRGEAPRHPQDHASATTFGRRRPEDGCFEWSRPARAIHDLVRAVTHPYPGARATLLGRPARIWRTRMADDARLDPPPAGGPGAGAARLVDGRLLVACGDGRWLEVVRAQLDGDVERDGEDLARRLTLPDTPTSTGP